MSLPPDPEMKRDALAGAPNFIPKPQPEHTSRTEKIAQRETALAHALRVALARKAVAQ
jgi:hypothetical protein